MVTYDSNEHRINSSSDIGRPEKSVSDFYQRLKIFLIIWSLGIGLT